MKLHLGQQATGSDFKLPLDFTTQSTAILAKRGSGKSYTADVCVEELLDSGQVPVIIDPTGAHWGLKSSASGKSAAYPMVVFGGEHADLPLEEGSGEATARAIVEQRFPAIIDISLMRKGAARRFLIPFFETLYRLNREPLTLIIDEADDICPQKPFGDEAQLVGAVEDIVKRGRKKGLGCILVTQRPADIAKNVLTQCEVLVAMRLVHPLDIKSVMEWVHVHADPEQAKQMVESLPSLPIGTAWFWSPGWGDIFERVQIRRRRTFDSGATPKPGERAITPQQLAEIDISKLGEQIAAAAQRAKENDPRELKTRISKLQGELAKMEASAILKEKVAAKVERVEVPVFTHSELAALEKLAQHLAGVERVVDNAGNRLKDVRDSVAKRFDKPLPTARHIQRPATPVRQTPAVAPHEARHGTSGGDLLGKCPRALLTVLVQFHPKTCSKNRLALVSGYSLTSSGFSNAISELRVDGLLTGSGELSPTQAGIDAIGSNYEPLPEGAAAVHHWIGKLGKCPSDLLASIHKHGMISRTDLAEETGYSVTSSGFSNSLSQLRVLGLIQTDRERAWLAPEFSL